MNDAAMKHGKSLLALALLLGACSPAVSRSVRDAPARAEAAPGGDVKSDVSLQVAALAQGKELLLAPGDTLHSGDQVAFVVQVQRPAYVYVVQVSSTGTPALLFPVAGDQQVLPGEPMRLPGPEGWFRLDAQVGEETVYVVTSQRPMGEGGLAARLGISLRGLIRSESADPPPPPPPPLADVDKRPVRASRDTTVHGLMDEGGVAALRFRFRHER